MPSEELEKGWKCSDGSIYDSIAFLKPVAQCFKDVASEGSIFDRLPIGQLAELGEKRLSELCDKNPEATFRDLVKSNQSNDATPQVTGWGLTESEFSQALSVAKLDSAVLKVRDNCQSEIGATETSRECKCAIHYADFVNETAFSIQYERCLKGLAAADKGEEFIKSLDDWKKAIESVEKSSADTNEPKKVPSLLRLILIKSEITLRLAGRHQLEQQA